MNTLNQKLKEKLQKALIHPSILNGCTEEEVARLESKWAQPFGLPPTYKEFLLTMGHGVSTLGHVEEFWFDFLESFQNYYKEYSTVGGLMDGQMDGKFPPNGFVIAMHFKYNWWLIKLDLGDQSPVYFWGEEEEQFEFRIKYPNIESFAFDMVSEIIETVEFAQKFTRINLSDYQKFILKCYDWAQDKSWSENNHNSPEITSLKKKISRFLETAYQGIFWGPNNNKQKKQILEERIDPIQVELNRLHFNQVSDSFMNEIRDLINPLWKQIETCEY